MALFDTIRAGASGATDFEIERSLRFNHGDSPYLVRTPSSAGNRRTWTWSSWVKYTTSDHANFNIGIFQSGNGGVLITQSGGGNPAFKIRGYAAGSNTTTTRLFRDPTAWFHVVLAVDTTQSTSSNRVKLYINGVQVTSFSTESYPSQNAEGNINDTGAHYIGSSNTGSGRFFDGYLAECNFIDGLQLTPSSFAETDADTGQWNPIKYTGSYGTNGFRLQFSDNSGTSATTLGKDTSGNGNNWTPNNFSVAANLANDSMPDSPTNNFCTLNPLNATSSFNFNIGEGNLVFDQSSNDQAITGTFFITSGKWYWEIYKNASQNPEIGICGQETLSNQSTGVVDSRLAFITNGGNLRTGSSSTASITGGSAQTGAGYIRIAVDMDNKKIWFSDTSGNYFNSGNPATGANAAYDFSSHDVANGWTPYVFMGTGSGHNCYMNFGQFELNSFSSNIPAGFSTLTSANLPEPTIAKGDQYFDIATWSGNDGSQTISSLGFQPDLVWIKATDRAENHFWTDSVRGAGKSLASNNTASEVDNSSKFTGFTSSGFTMNTTDNQINGGGVDFVGWNWAAGTAFSNSAGSNSATIASSGSVNTTAGFSVVSYQGNATRDQLVYHGLNAAPKWFLIKRRDGDNWYMYHSESADSNPQQYYYEFQNQDARKGANDAFMWDDIVPDSNNFGIYSDGGVNNNGSNIIAYVWSEVAGFSKFGHFIGNGNANGAYIHCGFTPRFVMVKNNNQGFNTVIQDTHRSPGNVANKKLCPDNNAAEASNDNFDILSNGFKMRTSDAGTNASGSRYVFMAFASNPFKYARAR